MYGALVDGLPLRDVVIPNVIDGLSLARPRSSCPERRSSSFRSNGGIAGWRRRSTASPGPTTGSSSTGRRHSACLTVNALTAADAVLDPDPVRVLRPRRAHATDRRPSNLVRDHLNPGLEINGVVLTMYRRPNESLGGGRRRGPPASRECRLRHRHPAQRPALRGAQLRPADRALPSRLARRRGLRLTRRGVHREEPSQRPEHSPSVNPSRQEQHDRPFRTPERTRARPRRR